MEWLTALTDQQNAIGSAPIPFLIVWAILTYGAYRFARHHFSERLATLEGRLSLRDDQIALFKERQAGVDAIANSRPGGLVSGVQPVTPLRPTTHSVQTETGAKEFLDSSITPQQLMALCEGKTTLQANKLTAGYVDKWMPITGALSNVNEHNDGTAFAAVDVPLEGRAYEATLWLSFARHEPELSSFSKGDTLRAVGKIEAVKGSSMDLKDCELIV